MHGEGFRDESSSLVRQFQRLSFEDHQDTILLLSLEVAILI